MSRDEADDFSDANAKAQRSKGTLGLAGLDLFQIACNCNEPQSELADDGAVADCTKVSEGCGVNIFAQKANSSVRQ